MTGFRWFPFLGFKTLDEDDLELYDIDVQPDFVYTALVFEWGTFAVLIVGWGKRVDKEDNAN